jgi:hypothetical protein
VTGGQLKLFPGGIIQKFIPQTYDAGNSSVDNDKEIDYHSKMNPGIRIVTILPYTE